MKDHLEVDMRLGPGGRPEGQVAGFGAGGAEQIVERAVRRRAADHDDRRRRRHDADRLQARQRIVVELVQVRDDGERIVGDQERVAVGPGADHVAGADHRSRPRTVLDDHGRSLHAADRIRHDTCDHVGAAAGRVRNHDPDRRFRPGAAVAHAHGDKSEGDRGQTHEWVAGKLHHLSPRRGIKLRPPSDVWKGPQRRRFRTTTIVDSDQ